VSDPGLRAWSPAPRQAEPGRPAAELPPPPRLALVPPSTDVSDPNRFMPGIEALRGIAAIAVVICHMWALTTATLFPGWQIVVGVGQWAVDVFFLLSGFLLVGYFWGDGPRPSLRDFYIRRFFRIAPAYYVSLLVLFLLFADRAVIFSAQGLRQAVANVTFTQWLFPTTATSLNVNGVYWTLSLEVVLYALLPVFAYMIARRPLLSSVGLIAVCMAYRLYIAFDAQPLQDFAFAAQTETPEWLKRLFLARQFPGILPILVIGMLLRWWLNHRPVARLQGLSLGWLLLLLAPSLLLLAGIELANDYEQWPMFVGFDFWLSLLLIPAVAYASADLAGALTRPFRALMWIGRHSYGIYLWHFPVILVIFQRGTIVRPAETSFLWGRIALAVVMTLLLGALSFRLVEEPSRKFARRLCKRRARPAAVAVPSP